MTVDGVVVVDKPAGMTSHDVVDHVRRLFDTRKIGHAGTLDPDATGLLILGLGRATRFLTYLQAAPKTYRAEATFGIATSTQDASGLPLSTRPADELDAAAVAGALSVFLGEIEQLPPMVSAIKVGGERLYRKARRGEEVERAPRRVSVYRFELTSFQPGPHPRAGFEIACSAGTYVRTLVHDLGEQLGCGAHLSSLRRIEAGGFVEADAIELQRLATGDLLPLEEVARPLERVEVDEDAARSIGVGKPIDAPAGVPEGSLRALFCDGRLLAVYRRAGAVMKAETVVGDLAARL